MNSQCPNPFTRNQVDEMEGLTLVSLVCSWHGHHAMCLMNCARRRINSSYAQGIQSDAWKAYSGSEEAPMRLALFGSALLIFFWESISG